MLYRIYSKNEMRFALLWIVLYIVLQGVANAVSEQLGVQYSLTVVICALMAAVIGGFLKRHDLLDQYGLCAFRGDTKRFLYFVPLIVLSTVNFWYGVTMNMSALESVLFAGSMICVGFLEEIIFRGFLLQALRKDNERTAVAIASLSFGFFHILNLLGGAPLGPTLLQVCYASAIGFLFTTVFMTGGSLVPCILTHMVVNVTSGFAREPSMGVQMAVAGILCLVCVSYSIWLWKTQKTEEMVSNEL